MSILGLPQTYANLRRLTEIWLTLARHGFSHILSQLPLAEHIPGLARWKAPLQRTPADEAGLATPVRLRMALQDLGTTYIKFGQLLATRPDLVPPAYAREFARLQDEVEPLPVAEIRKVLETSLGRPVDAVFAEFEDEPLASGSIGQVHRARLTTGEAVIVKVKRPGTDARVREDIGLLRELAKLVERHIEELRVLRPRMLVEEFARTIDRELDFVTEGAATGTFSRTFEEDETVHVPAVHWDYVTHDTLVIERIEGQRLTRWDLLEASGIDKRQLARTLGECFMRQFFINGVFHADPHPGNIFVLASDRIALIDFGQLGHLSEDLRRKLALSVLALAQGDIDLIVDMYGEIGVLTEETNLREFRNELIQLIDRYYGIPIDRIDMGRVFQESLSVARENGIQLPRDFVLLMKSFVTVFGVLRTLDPDFRVDQALKPFTNEIFHNLMSARGALRGLGFYLYRIVTMIRRAPDDARDMLEKVRKGRLRIIFHHEGLEGPAGLIEAATNRLTFGIIIAAILVGSSIVLAGGGESLGRYNLPVVGETNLAVLIAGFGFTLALFMALWLAWSMLRKRRII
jgi:ubiquinone biosynthesis protein